jgi:hypothetical protein
MVHVTQENVALIDVDLLIHECLRASEGKEAFAYIISPFLSDFEISSSWSMFTSNVIDVSDIDSYVDLLSLLRHHGGSIKVISRAPHELRENTTLNPNFVMKQAKLLSVMDNLRCEVRTNPSLHAKATITSQGVLSGSFNLTKSGRVFNIEAGFYFPNTKGVERREYRDKLHWAKELFAKSMPLNPQDLLVTKKIRQ